MRLDRRTDDSDAAGERNGELELPDDLAAMAEQLADDAQRLAACYPPKFGPVREVAAAVASVTPRRKPAAGAMLLVGSVTGGLVALGILAVLVLNGAFADRPTPHVPDLAATGVSDPSDLSNNAGNKLVASDADEFPEFNLRDRVVPAISSEAVPPLTPATWQRGVTGAEMEGLIDLAMDTESMEF